MKVKVNENRGEHNIYLAGKLWSRSLKLAYTLLNKLGTKNEPVLRPGDRVRVTHS